MKNTPLRLVLAFAAIYLIWGSTYLAIRYAVREVPPFVLMGARALAAGGVLLAITGRRRVSTIRPHQWCSALVAGGLLFGGGHGLLAWAQQRIPSGTAALVEATIPIWFVVLRAIPSKRWPSPLMVAGVIMGLAGVSILVGVPSGGHGAGSHDGVAVIGLIVSGMSWTFGSLYARRASLPSSLAVSTAMQLVAGGAVLMTAGTFFGEWGRLGAGAISWKSAGSLAYLVVFGSLIAFCAYNWLMRVVEPTVVGTYAFVNPVVAVILGAALGGERLDRGTLVAGAVIVAGSIVIHWAGRAGRSSSRRRHFSKEPCSRGRQPNLYRGGWKL